MPGFIKKLSLLPQGLRYKLMIAFTLMSIIPLLVLTYLVANHILVQDNVSMTQISVIVLISVVIAWLGLVLAKNIVEPVIDMSIEAKIIASGDLERKIRVTREDEIGELGSCINLLSKRIKDNIQELRDYGEKTKEINMEIQKKMLALSNLLQIGDLIAASVKLSKILVVVLEKLAMFYETGFTVAFLQKDDHDVLEVSGYHNVEDNTLLEAKVTVGEGYMGEIAKKGKITIIDSSTPRTSPEFKFKNEHRLANLVLIPLIVGKSAKGLILLGNSIKGFVYTNEDIDMIKVFSKQLSIAVENDMLMKKAKMLSMKDDLTDLYNKNYIVPRLNEEIGRAIIYQRPCSLLLVDIDNFKDYSDKHGQLSTEAALKKIADIINTNLGPIDKAARLGDDLFAIVLPEKNKKKAVEVANSIRDSVSSKDNAFKDSLTISVGLSENPLDGSNAKELFGKAEECLKKAKMSGKDTLVL